jgi:2-keto-3-deoxy-6-phosphogluconate aldolase
VNADAIVMAVASGAVSLPVVMTPSESFAALDSGASWLKMFPASVQCNAGIVAIEVQKGYYYCYCVLH